MNRVILIGRLTKDAEVRYSQGENKMAIGRFTIAVDRDRKKDGEQSADFINCVSFGKTAETIQKYVGKGRKIVIEGRWTTGSYTNKDGQKVYTNECTVDRFEFGDSKSENTESTATPGGDDFLHIPDGIDAELPF